jgi:hypothetical protein
MEVSQLIAATIAQHITQPKVLSYAPSKLNEVTGRFVASNRVYNFVLNKQGISYSPAGQGDSLLFSALYLRQDAVRKPKVGSDRCNAGKSYQCGKICLGNRRKCHKGVRDVNDARRIASILESTNEQLKNKVGSEISAKAKARGEALFGARGERVKNPKAERVKAVIASGKKKDFFDISPDDYQKKSDYHLARIQALLDSKSATLAVMEKKGFSIPEIEKYIKDETKRASKLSERGMNQMSGNATRSTAKATAQYGAQLAYKNLDEVQRYLVEKKGLEIALQKESESLKPKSISDIPNIPESAKPWVRSVENLATPELIAIAQRVGFPVITTEKNKNATAFYRPLANTISMGAHETNNDKSKITFLHEYGHYIDANLPSERTHISNTTDGVAARLADDKLLKKTNPKKILPKVNLYDKESVKKYLESSKKLLNVEPPEKWKDIDLSKSKQVIKDSIEKGDNLSVVDANNLSNHANYLAQFSPEYLASPMGQVRQLDDHIRGTVADLFGAITKNKIGSGHSTSYYNKGAHLQGTEAFANIIAIANSGDEKAIAVAKKFAPNMWKFVMDSIKV